MTILNNDVLGNYISITPFKATFTDTLQVNTLVCTIMNDNLTNGCVIRYDLYNLTITDSVTARIMYTDTISITGTDYTNWQGDSTFVYTYIATKIGLTITS